MMKFIALALAMALAAAPARAQDPDPGRSPESGLRVVESDHGVAITLDRVEQIVAANGARIFARIDHAAGADAIGAELAPTQVLIFGDPRMGTPLIREARTTAIDLPVRMLAWREAQTVRLAYTAPETLAGRHGFDAAAARSMARALASIAETAAGSGPLP